VDRIGTSTTNMSTAQTTRAPISTGGAEPGTKGTSEAKLVNSWSVISSENLLMSLMCTKVLMNRGSANQPEPLP
jgi:hypothetical protein